MDDKKSSKKVKKDKRSRNNVNVKAKQGPDKEMDMNEIPMVDQMNDPEINLIPDNIPKTVEATNPENVDHGEDIIDIDDTAVPEMNEETYNKYKELDQQRLNEKKSKPPTKKRQRSKKGE